MSRTKLRGFFLFAAAMLWMNVAVANDPFSFASPIAEFGTKLPGEHTSQLSSDSIDRYMHNAQITTFAEDSAAYDEEAVSVATGWRLSRDTVMIAIIAACVALGIGLCLTGAVMTRKPAMSGGRTGLIRIC